MLSLLAVWAGWVTWGWMSDMRNLQAGFLRLALAWGGCMGSCCRCNPMCQIWPYKMDLAVAWPCVPYPAMVWSQAAAGSPHRLEDTQLQAAGLAPVCRTVVPNLGWQPKCGGNASGAAHKRQAALLARSSPTSGLPPPHSTSSSGFGKERLGIAGVGRFMIQHRAPVKSKSAKLELRARLSLKKGKGGRIGTVVVQWMKHWLFIS